MERKSCNKNDLRENDFNVNAFCHTTDVRHMKDSNDACCNKCEQVSVDPSYCYSYVHWCYGCYTDQIIFWISKKKEKKWGKGDKCNFAFHLLSKEHLKYFLSYSCS